MGVLSIREVPTLRMELFTDLLTARRRCQFTMRADATMLARSTLAAKAAMHSTAMHALRSFADRGVFILGQHARPRLSLINVTLQFSVSLFFVFHILGSYSKAVFHI